MHSTDIADVETYLPDEEDNFGFTLRAIIGPTNEEGEESFDIEPKSKMCIADSSERKRWSKMVVRELIRESGLSPTTVYKILEGKPVRCYILSGFIQAIDKTSV